ncbi:hypothetical protein GXW78_25440 [Roseomonas terrae]|uniref:Uncharacterized protein n=1 Tax=Neoroseomonas terrae TaxID=424799 RepID=A0ABS5EPS8_9PROT|nr:hypothetical protein [Neoroseomonas terrae]MBR0653025.1 hypothetical protein [Neoroseomonas terrae]
MIRLVLHALILAVAAGPVVAAAQEPQISGAPAGDAGRVALRAIHGNFNAEVCPRLTRAERQQNGSIHAVCDNGESFRVFRIGDRIVAMRCAAAARYGIEGC